MVALIDSSVVIDLLRGYAPAQDWFLQQEAIGVSRAVWLEVIEGAQSRQAQRSALQLLEKFRLVELTEADFTWATEQLLRFYLSHHVDAFDCLIASASHRLGVPLYTRNLKHFQPLLNTLAQAPY